MTGLDLTQDTLIEIAVLVTDSELNILGDGVDLVIKPSDAALDHMDSFVTAMHTNSGLINELADGTTLEQAETIAMDYIQQFVHESGKAPLAGNTIGTDRSFLAKEMPTLEGFLNYRNIDVSSIKELARRWYPKAFFAAPEKHGNHRALGDIIDSINELRYWREAIFVPEPGPVSIEARQIAVKYEQPAAPQA